jgi:hypothetical protein
MSKNSFKPIVLHRKMEKEAAPREYPVDIILSPEFYVLRKEKVAVRRLSALKRIAPSVLAPYINQDASLRYFVFPCREDRCFVAYDPEEIEAFLNEVGIPAEKVGKIYFAQQFENIFEEPVRISSDRMLWTVDGIVTLLPAAAGSDTAMLPQTVQRPSSGVTFEKTAGGLSPKMMTILSVAMLLFAAMWMTEGIRYTKGSKILEESYRSFLQHDPKLADRHIRENLLQKYTTLDKIERRKRQIVRDVSKLVSSKTPLKKLQLTKTGYEVRLGCNGTSCADRIAKKMKKMGLHVVAQRPDEVAAKGKW